MFRRVLIANRGEIAIRIARTCHEMGIQPVGLYSDIDRDGLHRRHLDESVEIGPAPATESYLNIERVLGAALQLGADAIHPGYGFLAENATFAKRCEEAGLVFVGPGPDAMTKSGDKIGARAAMVEAGIPVTPGSGVVASAEEAAVAANELGFPVMLKASGGGGGIGMQAVFHAEDMDRAFQLAQSAAVASFGDPSLFVEKLHPRPRHVEVQVFLDRQRNAVHLGERECSIQRRHQKLVEESPSPIVGPETRRELCDLAVRGMRAIGYVNAGTVEFLQSEGRFYFNEINARLQVEHTVTEAITGLDLVREQIRVAAGESLSVSQDEVTFHGWSIECRVNAEDPTADFSPSPGVITRYHEPGGPGVRVDSGVAQGSVVQRFYDPLVAKVITHGRNRHDAIARMSRALREFAIEGIATVLPLHRRILLDDAFRRGELATTFLVDRGILTALALERDAEVAALAAALASRPSLAAHLRPHIALRPTPTSRWAMAARPHVGGDYASPHRTRRPRP